MNTTTERPAPPVGPLSNQPVVRERKTAIALGTLALIAIGYVVWVVNSEWVPAPDEPAAVAEFIAGSPSGDFFTPVDAIGRSGVREQNALIERLGPVLDNEPTVMSETIVHEANAVSSRLGSISLYRWQAVDSNGVITDCFGEFLDNGTASSNNCGTVETGQPLLGWGVPAVEAEHPLNFVSIWNTPEAAEWLVITSAAGQTIVSPVANQVSYSDWDGGNNAPIKVELLDKDFGQLWIQTIS